MVPEQKYSAQGASLAQKTNNQTKKDEQPNVMKDRQYDDQVLLEL